MAGEPAGAAGTRGERELVFALCHEIGNLLAAGRLESGLLAGGAATDPAAVGRRLSEVAARAGALLALVRPLLDGDRAPALATDPAALLGALRGGLDAERERCVAVDADAALPDARVEADVVHHLLLAAVYLALEEAGRARVTAREVAGRVELAVEHPAPGPPRREDGALRGRALVGAVAEVLLARSGGRIAVEHGGAATRVVLSLPRAAA
jgi:hypothetical protein